MSSKDGGKEWQPIESDPLILTKLVQKLGAKNIAIKELYNIDIHQFHGIDVAYGLIFLYKWRPSGLSLCKNFIDYRNISFGQQVIQNACVTQALANLLCNLPDDAEVCIGHLLENFKEEALWLNPATRGLAFCNNDELLEIHNSFSSPESPEIDMRAPEKDFKNHFIVFMPFDGFILEMDGMSAEPANLGPAESGIDWLRVILPFMNDWIAKFTDLEIRFELYAVVNDIPNDSLDRSAFLEETGKQEVEMTLKQLEDEEEELIKMRKQSTIRRHNYTPFIVEFLKLLAKENKLDSLVTKNSAAYAKYDQEFTVKNENCSTENAIDSGPPTPCNINSNSDLTSPPAKRLCVDLSVAVPGGIRWSQNAVCRSDVTEAHMFDASINNKLNLKESETESVDRNSSSQHVSQMMEVETEAKNISAYSSTTEIPTTTQHAVDKVNPQENE